MGNKQLASFPLVKEVLDRTSQEVIELLLRLLSRVDELESRLSKHSGNSDKPPSSDSPFRKRESGSPTKTSVHKRGGFLQKLLPATETTSLLPHLCSCGRLVKAELPSEKRTGYGPRLSAMVVELAGCHGDSRQAVQGEDFVERLLSFRQTCLLQEKRTYPYWVEAFERYFSGSKPSLFFDVCESCHGLISARSLLSLKLYIFTVTNAVLAVLCQGCVLSFSGHGSLRQNSLLQGM